MKALVIGDFHGEFPSKFKKIIKNQKIDLIISIGDFPPFHYRKIWFKYCYGNEKELWEFIGKKKYRKLVLEDFRLGEKPLKELNSLNIPVYTVLGNVDYPPPDVYDMPEKRERSMPNWMEYNAFPDIIKKYKRIKRFDYSYFKFGNYIFIGMRGHSAPGRTKR